MKISIQLIFLLFLISVGCQQSKNTETFGTANDINDTISNHGSYAEISTKEGGKWKESIYEGGSFKNIFTLKVPENHTDHSGFIRYEGPGWESSKVGYRLYLDWRNAIDIFGKKTDRLVLSEVGQDDFGSYHEMNDWGMDILKVGEGLGIGSIGRYVDNKVLHFNEVDSTTVDVNNSKRYSSININYYGWKTKEDKINLSSVLSIAPNQRYTKHSIQPSHLLSGICTGIVKHDVEVVHKKSKDKKWGYIATYGEQTLALDNLGMAILYQTETVASVVDSEFDHLVVFKPSTDEISFYFLAAWEQEYKGIKSMEAFLSYLDELLFELDDKDSL